MDEYEFTWHPKEWVTEKLVREYAQFYSSHYGYWKSSVDSNEKRRVRLSAEKIKEWFEPEGNNIAEARRKGELIGYAIAIQGTSPKGKKISWVTQLVVHEQYRDRGIGKRLLFSFWSFSDFYAWGLASSNPYAIRALEKATRRRCDPLRIKAHKNLILNFGKQRVSYIQQAKETVVGKTQSVINTNFHVDHSQIGSMIAKVTTENKNWSLGPLQEGWEWLAFTFQDQPQISLTPDEINTMLVASDQTVKNAYSRMSLDHQHSWAKHTDKEAEFIIEHCQLVAGQTVLDLGCGIGRHAHALASQGLMVTGIDYIEKLIEKAKKNHIENLKFQCDDCRQVDLQQQFDVVLCLYDVIGSYAKEEDNKDIILNIVRHLKIGGYALMSVMNFELTQSVAKHYFSLEKDYDRLLDLKPSMIMEKTGDVFNPDYFMIEKESRIVYRREQFQMGNRLPEEFIVRDKRYTEEEITKLCASCGLKVLWSRFVRAGQWQLPLQNIDPKAKEILLLCRKEA
ncbi:MAG: GNAT family N-acetyltransferase [Magnetococcales bacterium]|nr:GNAT family N-acetyltransferase [Magnetococcales bacterium]